MGLAMSIVTTRAWSRVLHFLSEHYRRSIMQFVFIKSANPRHQEQSEWQRLMGKKIWQISSRKFFQQSRGRSIWDYYYIKRKSRRWKASAHSLELPGRAQKPGLTLGVRFGDSTSHRIAGTESIWSWWSARGTDRGNYIMSSQSLAGHLGN